MTTIRATALAMTVLATTMLGVAACAGSPSGAHPPARTGLAPPITLDQLFITRYLGKPCDLLTPDRQTQHRLIPPGSAEQPARGPAECRWQSRLAAEPTFTAGIDPTRGLEDRYRQRAEIGFFEPTDISSYPALHTAAESNGPKLGHCTTEVAVTDTALLLVSVDYGSAHGTAADDPCADSDTLALAIMGQLKQGGG